MQNFNWQYTFKRFLFGFILANAIVFLSNYFAKGITQLSRENLTGAFTFAILYAIFSAYMQAKNQPK
jgi:hypothetical protein